MSFQNLSRNLIRQSYVCSKFAARFASTESKLYETDRSNQTHFGYETVDENEKSGKGKKDRRKMIFISFAFLDFMF